MTNHTYEKELLGRIDELEAKLLQDPKDARCQLYKQTQKYQAEAERCNRRIDELEAELALAKSFHDVAVKERNYERADNQRLQTFLNDAWQRMDRARDILTDGNPRPECNWGMLDTKLDREAYEDRSE